MASTAHTRPLIPKQYRNLRRNHADQNTLPSLVPDDETIAHVLAVVLPPEEGRDDTKPNIPLRLFIKAYRKGTDWHAVQPNYPHALWTSPPDEATAGSIWIICISSAESIADESGGDHKPYYPVQTTTGQAAVSDNSPENKTVEHPRRVFRLWKLLPQTPKVSSSKKFRPMATIRGSISDRTAVSDAVTANALANHLERVRKHFCEDGDKEGGAVLVLLPDGCGTVGPLFLEPRAIGSRTVWCVRPECYPLRQSIADNVGFHIGGAAMSNDWYLDSKSELPNEIGIADFRTIDTVLDAVSAASIEQEAEADMKQNEILSAAITAGAGEDYTLARIASGLSKPENNPLLAKLLALPLVRAEIEAAKMAALDQAKLEAEEYTAQVLRGKEKILQKAQKDTEDAQKDAEAAHKALQAAQADLLALNRQIHKAETRQSALTDARIAEIAAQVAAQVASAVAPAIVPYQPQSDEPVAPLPLINPFTSGQNAAAPRTLPLVRAADRLAEDLFAQEVAQSDIDAQNQLVFPLFGAWLAGLIPVIVGSGARYFLQMASETISAGRHLFVSATPDLSCLTDVFGCVHHGKNGTTRFVPHAAGLADVVILLQDESPSKTGGQDSNPILAVFNGIEIADVSVWLPLMEAFQAAAQNDVLGAVLSLLHPNTLCANDPYRPLARCAWPSELLPAFICRAPLSLPPLPPTFWRHAVLIQVEEGEEPPAPIEIVYQTVMQWSDYQKANLPKYRDEAKSDARLIDEATSAHRFYAALRCLGMEVNEAERCVREKHIYPQRISAGETEEGIVGSVAYAVEGDENAEKKAAQAVRALLRGEF